MRSGAVPRSSLASGAEPYDNFGQSVAISADGNTAVVSAPNRIVDGSPQGEAYIFTRTQGKWGSPAELSPGWPVTRLKSLATAWQSVGMETRYL